MTIQRLYNRENYNVAIDLYTKAIQNDKTNEVLYLNRAFVYNFNAKGEHALRSVFNVLFQYFKPVDPSYAKKAIEDVEEANKLFDLAPDSIKAHLYCLAYKYARKAYQEAKILKAGSEAEALKAKSEVITLDDSAFNYFKILLKYVS